MAKKNLPLLSEALISLNIESSSMITLSAINAGKLQEKGYVSQAFVSDVIASQALNLGNNVFINDSPKGNQANGVAIARNSQGQTLLTIAATDSSLQTTLSHLLKANVVSQFATASITQLLALLGGNADSTAEKSPIPTTSKQVIGTFTVRNENGIHARPAAVLVQTAKPFNANITVENLDRSTPPVNAKSTMKVVALGASQAHRLRFVAEGDDALQAIEALQKAFLEGLGEQVSFVPSIEDSIESGTATIEAQVPTESETESPATKQVEACFIIKNEHGLHARPSAVLVNEVKKFSSKIEVQNVDKNSPLVSAKSLMKIVALGVTKGTTLRFIAIGDDAETALDAIGKAIEAGLGE